MQDLIEKLTANVDITPEQARQVIDVVSSFVADRVPSPIGEQVGAFLEGKDDAIASGAEEALGKLGGMFGG